MAVSKGLYVEAGRVHIKGVKNRALDEKANASPTKRSRLL
jgi:hypothetical protein